MGRPVGADDESVEPASSSLALWRDASGAIACALLGIVSFAGVRRVPVPEWIDLAIHESGHAVTYAFPDLITAMMGSIAQVAVPLAIAAYFLWRRDVAGCLARPLVSGRLEPSRGAGQ